MRNNRFVFLFVLLSVGLVLRYSSQKHPFESLKRDLSGLIGTARAELPQILKKEDVARDGYDSEATDTKEGGDTHTLDEYLPAYGKKDQIIRREGYVLDYQEEYEQASWVVHRLLNKTGRARRAENFQPDPLVKTKTALPFDYSGTGYDRGHLAPAGDFNYDQRLKYDTFYMSNMSPQAHDFNTGIWNDIEQKVRSWSKKRGDLVIVTGPVLRKGLPTIGKSTRIAVPEFYYKLVYDPQKEEAIAFLIENKAWVDVLMKDFTTSIDEVEEKTGIDFFARLPKKLQDTIESQHDVQAWFGRSRK